MRYHLRANKIDLSLNTPANNADTNEGLTERISYINLDSVGGSLPDVADS